MFKDAANQDGEERGKSAGDHESGIAGTGWRAGEAAAKVAEHQAQPGEQRGEGR